MSHAFHTNPDLSSGPRLGIPRAWRQWRMAAKHGNVGLTEAAPYSDVNDDTEAVRYSDVNDDTESAARRAVHEVVKVSIRACIGRLWQDIYFS